MLPPVRRVSLSEARQLIAAGYLPLDVRSESEFAEGHIPSARNIPLMQPEGDRLQDNPEFLNVVRQRIARHERVLISCRSGKRSLRAAHLLVDAGYTHVVELRTGFEGCRDEFGTLEPGWRPAGCPVERVAPVENTYEQLRRPR